MIKLIYGAKGTGKTKIIINEANTAASTAKGQVVFITEKKTYSVNIDFNIKYLCTEDFAIDSPESFRGFMSGIVAANFDNEYIFVDGIARITHANLADLQSLFDEIDKLVKQNGINVVFTISSALEDLPDYLRRYL